MITSIRRSGWLRPPAPDLRTGRVRAAPPRVERDAQAETADGPTPARGASLGLRSSQAAAATTGAQRLRRSARQRTASRASFGRERGNGGVEGRSHAEQTVRSLKNFHAIEIRAPRSPHRHPGRTHGPPRPRANQDRRSEQLLQAGAGRRSPGEAEGPDGDDQLRGDEHGRRVGGLAGSPPGDPAAAQGAAFPSTKLESLGQRVDRAVGVLLRLAEAWKQKLLDRGRFDDDAAAIRRASGLLRFVLIPSVPTTAGS